MARVYVPISKKDTSQHIVYGWGNISVDETGLVEDRQEDCIEPPELEGAVIDFMLNSRDSGVMHEGDPVAKVVASLVTTPDIMAAFFGKIVDAETLKRIPIGWMIGVKILNDVTWQRVLSGELTAFSIQGSADRVEVDDVLDAAA